MMEKGGREIFRRIGRVAMLSIGQITLDNRRKSGVLEPCLAQAIKRRGEARNGRCEEDTAGLENAVRFTQGR